ncbi:MAG: glycoside hydrolase family 2 protein, partial [Rhodoblastus sp.]|nr:glycoside hydrolase family 2 protein [Rhodoblastus sp.]
MRLDSSWLLAICAADAAPTPVDADALVFFPAQVPGTAAQALIDNDGWSWDAPLPLDDRDIWYRTTISGAGAHVLVFGGLATFAEVWL